jgi:hypothetical protein
VVAGRNAFDGGWVDSDEGTNTDSCCVCMGWGGGSCGAEGVYVCAGWNTCVGAEGWKDWW